MNHIFPGLESGSYFLENIMRYQLFVLCGLLTAFSTATVASPDVIFSDSAAYDGIILKHELNGDKIKFLLSGNVSGITVPDEFYSVEALVDFLESGYVFTNKDKDMNIEFLRMLKMSIESKFTLKEFMAELNLFLNEFKLWSSSKESAQDSAGGCGATNASSSPLLIACLLYLFLRQRHSMHESRRG